ncbi:motility associated factor glycosyltransferase family protein [Lysinibacillus sp. C5.1]|uniref:motility associated factor glycosyltransferase family protein n=1 Tax=Lysinibacillus sp. C5.1 TaxID=2796169 RepID=UPI0030822002
MILEDYKVETISTSSGLDTLKVNGYLLHSKFDPLKESEKIIEKNYKPGYVHVIFGYGLGYIVQSFLEKMEGDDKLVIIEPLFDVELEHDNVIVLSNIQNIEDLKQPLYSAISIVDKFHIICSPNYDKVFPQFYKDFLKLLKDNLTVAKVNENTIMYYGEQWQKNYILNLEYAVQDSSILKLKDKFSCPVIVASGGPSLSKQLATLKTYRKNIVLIAAGSTINSLVSEGIEPDYVISIDGAAINYEHYKKITFKNTSFVYTMSSFPKIRECFDTECFFALSPTDRTLQEHLSKITNQESIILAGGGSCAHYALTLALYLTSGPITLIGQDLAYTNNKSHADNNVRVQEINREEMLNTGGILVDGYNGGKVLTDYPFLGMKETFERIISVSEDKDRVFNSTEGGAKIKGFSQLPFKEFCEKYCNEIIVSTSTPIKKENNEEKILILKEQIQDEIEAYKTLKKLLEANEKLILKNTSKIAFSKSILKKLDENDNEFEDLAKKTALTLSLDPIKISVLKNFKPEANESAEDSYKRVKLQSLTLYREMNKAVDNIIDYANILLEKINQ